MVRNIEAAAFDRGDLGFASRVSADGSDKAPVDREFSSAEWVVLGEDGPIRPLRNCPGERTKELSGLVVPDDFPLTVDGDDWVTDPVPYRLDGVEFDDCHTRRSAVGIDSDIELRDVLGKGPCGEGRVDVLGFTVGQECCDSHVVGSVRAQADQRKGVFLRGFSGPRRGHPMIPCRGSQA